MALPGSQSFGAHLQSNQKWMKPTFWNRHPKRSPRSLAGLLASTSPLSGVWTVDNEVTGGNQAYFLAEKKRLTLAALEKQRPRAGCPVAGLSLSCFACRSQDSYGPMLVSLGLWSLMKWALGEVFSPRPNPGFRMSSKQPRAQSLTRSSAAWVASLQSSPSSPTQPCAGPTVGTQLSTATPSNQGGEKGCPGIPGQPHTAHRACQGHSWIEL